MSRKRHHLEHEISAIVDRELKGNIELKRQITGFDLSPIYTGSFVTFTTIAQGNTSNLNGERLGNQIVAKSLHLSFYAQAVGGSSQQNSNSNAILSDCLLRLIVFSWVPYGPLTSTEGAILDLGNSPGAGYEVTAPWMQQRGEYQFKIHHDKTYSVNPQYTSYYNTSGTPTAVNIAWSHTQHHIEHIRLDHAIDYQNSTSGANAIGHVGMLVLSNLSSVALAPVVIGQGALYYTDA